MNIVHGGAGNPSRANSLQGICDSVASGVDAIEVDVQGTRDGEPVLFHDSSFCVDGRQVRLSDLSLSELASITVAGKHLGIPLLRDVLELLRGTNTLILLDIKSRGIIDAVMRVIQDARAEDRTLIASFDYSPLTRAKEIHPTLPTILIVGFSRIMASPLGFLWTIFAFLFPLLATTRVQAHVILCPANRVTQRLIRKAHQRHIAVFVWKLTDITKAKRVVNSGVDGLVTAIT